MDPSRDLDARLQRNALELQRLRADNEQLRRELAALTTSTSWRLTHPVRVAARVLPTSVRGLLRAMLRSSWRLLPPLSMRRRIPEIRARGVLPPSVDAAMEIRPMSRCSPDEESASSSAYREEAQTWDVGDLIDAHLPELRPFRTFYTSDSEPRVNLVVDSEVIGGGDSPAFIFSALLANRMRASLRILTREAPGDPAAFGRLLALNDVRLFGTLELEQLSYGDDVNDSPDFEIGDQDLFVTTSWKTTRAATQSAPVGRVIYLVSDDERMHLSAGDARIMCSEVLSDDRIKTVVISRGLHRHLIETGLERLTHDGLCFDPAFPQHTFQSRPRSGMNRFLFCVRRHHPEDLIIRGLEAVNTAVETGVLPRSWALTFVGVRDHLRVAGGAQSRVHADIGLDGFVDELRRTDLTLSLRLSPVCPFPALAAVATGGVAVTNARPCRLAPPIGNLLSADVATASLVGALERGARLALDSATRASNYNQQEFPRSWTMAVGPVLDRIVPA